MLSALPTAEINAGDTAWVLTFAALVLLMTPGLVLFSGGMVRAKSVINMMMMSFIALGTISVAYDLVARGGRLGTTGHGMPHDARHHGE